MYTNLIKRVDDIRNAKDLLAKANENELEIMCIDNRDVLGNSFLLYKRIGEDSNSINGEAWKMCYPFSCNNQVCYCSQNHNELAMKKIPLKASDIIHTQDITSKGALEQSVWAELMCMQLGQFLVEHSVTPNLPLFVAKKLCLTCHYTNTNILRNTNSSDPITTACVLMINELATVGDLNTWLREQRTAEECYSALFQIFNALYALQKYYNMTHHDLHGGNVLVHCLSPDTPPYLQYTIDNVVYIVPHHGFLFTLWDFGYAYIPNKLHIKTFQHHFKWDKRTLTNIRREDYRHILHAFKSQTNPDVNKFIQTIDQNADAKFSLRFMFILFGHFLRLPFNGNMDTPIHEKMRFNLDKPIALPKPWNDYLRLNLSENVVSVFGSFPAPDTPIGTPIEQDSIIEYVPGQQLFPGFINLVIPKRIPRNVDNILYVDISNVPIPQDPNQSVDITVNAGVLQDLMIPIVVNIVFPTFWTHPTNGRSYLEINIPDNLFYDRTELLTYSVPSNRFRFIVDHHQ